MENTQLEVVWYECKRGEHSRNGEEKERQIENEVKDAASLLAALGMVRLKVTP